MIQINFKDEGEILNVLIHIFIPEKCIERNIECNLNSTVYSFKFDILKLLPDLDDPLNYGFFLPENNGKIGKFLQEERILSHYLVESPYKLELRRKIRMSILNTTKLKKVNCKSNQKQFILNIKHGEIMKINKLLNDGLDPNFHINGIPETPLTLACRIEDPHKIIMALISNGAYMDFRASDSLTALHKVAKDGLYQPMKTLLQLGQSPNCKDSKGYTPLYYCIENDAPAECVNLLLFEHSILGIRDEQGFQEIHKACLYGRTVHLDHLLTYGADIDAKTNKGNTALHICAVHDQGSCARLLLYRGITRYALDSENKSAYQTALLSNNLEIADLIQNFKDEDVVPVTSLPKFNEKRRSIVPLMKRFSSSNGLDNENDDNKSNLTEVCTVNSGENNNLYGSIQSLPMGSTSTSSNSSQFNNRNFQLADSQSLKNFTNPISKISLTHLNTWSSPDCNVKSNTKTRIPIASIMSSKLENIPRIIVLQRGQHGFGFIIRGIKNEFEINAKPNNTATQYFECVAENSPAYQAGLLTGDHLLEVNNIDVHEMSHENVVKIIQLAGDCLTLKVITINPIIASNSIFDGNSENKSNSDSQSFISENSNSLSVLNNEYIIENSKISMEQIKKVDSKHKTEKHVQNIPPLLPTETNESYFIKSKLKNNIKIQDNSSITGVKKSKFQAPPPPTRNESTSLSVNTNNENSTSKTNENGHLNVKPILNSVNVNLELPIHIRNSYNAEHITMSDSNQRIPPPDYISDSDIESKSLVNGSLISIKNEDINILFPANKSACVCVPPVPAPPPIPQPSHNYNNINSKVRMPSNLNEEIANISLKPVSQVIDSSINTDMGPPLNDHSEALKNAVLNHRRKIECGESQSDHIEEKLRETKVGNKSLLFQANAVLSPNTENNKATIIKSTAAKSFDFTDDKHISTNVSKSPAVHPKPNTQLFPQVSKTDLIKSPKPLPPKSIEFENCSKPMEQENQLNNDINLRYKAENLRTNLLKKEQENKKKGTLYFTIEK